MGKRILCLVASVIAIGAHNVRGQVRSEYFRSLSADLQVNGGLLSQKITTIPFSENYPQALNALQSDIRFSSGQSMGYDFRLGYYFNKKRSLGVGAGITFYKQTGNLNLDTFHIEFRSTDAKYATFRQMISTTRGIREEITARSFNIPVVLKYKKDFNSKLALTVDAGIVYNLNVRNSYNTDARFNYEAIYLFEGGDSTPIPSSQAYLVTRDNFIKKYPNDDIVKYFDFHQGMGKSVGLNLAANERSGNVRYKSGSLGYTGEIAVNYMFVRNICLRAGVYYTAQSFTNTSNNNALPLTDAVVRDANNKVVGTTYNSMLNEMQTARNANYGIVLGARVYFNRMAWKAPVDDVNRVTPAKGRAH
jgi:hypothetical protein